MVDNIRVLNMTTGVELSMQKSMKSPFVLETDGINWGSVSAEHNTFSNLTGVGDIITSSKLHSRIISVTGRICSTRTNKEIAQYYGVSSVKEIAEKKIEEIEAAKKELSQVINPLQYVRILSSTYYIQGKPSESVTFSNLWRENNEIYCKFTFTINCSDPLFHYQTTTHTQLSGVSSGFHFPIIIPSPNGMHFGVRRTMQLVNINNDSDVSLGGIIYLKATGTVDSPTLTNVWTQETLKVNKTLQENEVVKIDTINRKITGALDGENFENYFAYWVFTNTWFQFDVGDTLFGFTAEGTTFRNLEIWIELNKSFYSMEDQ